MVVDCLKTCPACRELPCACADLLPKIPDQPVGCSPLLPPWFDIATAPKNGATILGMYAAKESYLGDDGPRHHIVRWFDKTEAFSTIDSNGEPERTPTLTHWQPLTYLHCLYGHVVYPVAGSYYAYALPTEWKVPEREIIDLVALERAIITELTANTRVITYAEGVAGAVEIVKRHIENARRGSDE